MKKIKKVPFNCQCGKSSEEEPIEILLGDGVKENSEESESESSSVDSEDKKEDT